MGSKKQKTEATQYNSALAAANTKSPLQMELEGQAQGTLDWIKKGDYRQRPKNIFFNLFDPSELRRHRELVSRAGGQGTVALGAGNPTALALDKQNRDDENAASDSQQYEADVAGAGQRAAALGGDMAGMDQARRLAILNTTAGVYANRSNQPQWWERLLQTGGQVGAGLASNPGLFATGGAV